MFNKKIITKKLLSGLMAAALVATSMTATAFAAAPTSEGTYKVDATLSCYVNAMGGVEFSDGYGLLTGTTVEIAEDGTVALTMGLGQTSGLSIYGVACTAFIGTDEAPGYYEDGAVTKEGVTYTTSTDTVANASGQVNYITSITMPVDTATQEYTLWIYLDSNVMGCQLGDGSGTGASNTPGVTTKHTAKLTIDWDTAEEIIPVEEIYTQDATITYVYEEPSAEYEIEIPSAISVGEDGTATYTVKAKSVENFSTNEYVTVTAPATGKLSRGEDSVAFTNTLTEGKLDAKDEVLNGTVKVTETPSASGTYTGTLTFTINFHSKGE